MSASVRSLAVAVIQQILNGQSLNECLPKAFAKLKNPKDQALLQALCYGVCRWYWRLDALLSELLEKPLKAKDEDIHILLLLGLYQLTELRIPDYAVISETVNVARELKKDWAKSLVNGVLRNWQRKETEIEEQDLEGYFSHPMWFIEHGQKAWPDYWHGILVANNQQPPFSLRINQKKLSREDYLKKCAEQGLEANSIPHTLTGITVANPMGVAELPGFSTGECSVQDGAAQLAAVLLDLKPNQLVLDACAAPGGKACHILELMPSITLLAVDKDPARSTLIQENLHRLGLSAQVLTQDVSEMQGFQGQQFDRILLDAPCSASGVIRRHPDIKLLRQPTDIPSMVAEQQRLLRALWPALKPGGVLVYATCSIFPEENVRVIQEFMAAHKDAREEKIAGEWGLACEYGRQILPGMHGMDGFYYACLKKNKT